MEENNSAKDNGYRIGIAVFILLLALTAGEYFIGWIAIGWTWPLWGIALIKAAYIIRDYMHISRVFGVEEETHS